MLNVSFIYNPLLQSQQFHMNRGSEPCSTDDSVDGIRCISTRIAIFYASLALEHLSGHNNGMI
jgi:hypothetical protein